MVYELLAYGTDSRYGNDIRWREYTTSKKRAEMFAKIPRIQFSDSGHGVVFQAKEHKGKRLPRIDMIRTYVQEQRIILQDAAKANKPQRRTQQSLMKERIESIRSSLESMVWQFANRTTIDGKLALTDCGLSALEEAFSVLGWDSPHFIDDPSMECDVEGCHDWRGPQIHWDGMYSMICSRHHTFQLAQMPRPPMKQSAMDREAKRDKDGILRE